MNETPTNQTPETPELALRADDPSTGAPTQPTGSVPPQYAPPPYQQALYPPQAPPPLPASLPRRGPMGGSIVGPILLIGAGVLFLLNNLGIVDWAVWGGLWRLWPLALVAVGLDLLFGRRRPWLSTLIVLLLLAASIGLLFYTGFGSGGKLNTYNLNFPIAGAKSASVDISFGTGDLTIDSRANSQDLATGSLEYYSDNGAPNVRLDRNTDSTDLTIRSNEGFHFGFFNIGSVRAPHWDIHLNPALPTTLKVDLGAGNTVLNLSDIKLLGLTVDGGAGNASVTFPAVTQPTVSTIDGGVGNLTLHIPKGTEARITIDSGIGNVHIDSRFAKQSSGPDVFVSDPDVYVTAGYDATPDSLDLRVGAGVGNIDITP
jgi:hypothetical protein